MAHFLYRLFPPRPDFPAGMTEEEDAAMARHGAYWLAQINSGAATAVGPVFAPDGTFGLAVFDATDAEAAAGIAAADPVLSAGLGFTHRVDPMPSLLRPPPRR
ncbi:YciI family protein [Roseomonas sp. CCTCC AB2023176]|uniref:YciI family protein n=1 Tax=Roseomonas sp. CCTCC AB2023176 TaxID=3342640 RepID=UPI0035E03D0B